MMKLQLCNGNLSMTKIVLFNVQINVDEHSFNCKASECSSTPKKYHFTPGKDQDVLSQV